MDNQPQALSQAQTMDQTTDQCAVSNGQWLAWPSKTRKNSFRATVIAILFLVILWLFGNPTLQSMAYFTLVTPIVLVLSLVILAASNIAFSIFYARRHRLSAASASVSQQSKSNHSRRTMPGSASRHLFHYLRPAKFTRPVHWSNIMKQRRQEQAAKYRTPIVENMPQFSEAVDTVIELIMRDYVAGWMRAITPEVVLQQRLEELLRIILIRLKTRVMDLDLTQFLVTKIVPKVTTHVNDFRKAEMALRGNSLERSLTESDELDIMVAGKFRNGKLHKALSTSISTKATEEAYLRNVVQAILPTLLPTTEVQSEILRHLLRELLVCAVLRPVMELLSDPDYWNQNVDLYIGKAIREQNMVKKLREALKQHTDNMDADPLAIDIADPYGSGADIYSFEEFVKMIKRCDSLLDVKRIRNTIMTQIRKKKAQTDRRDNMNELQFWLLIDTLNIRAEIEQKAETDSAGSFGVDGHAATGHKSAMSTPSSTFSRTQGQKALEAMTPTSLNTTAGPTPSSNLSSSIRSSRKASIATTIDITDTLRDDVRMIYETYFAESAPRPVVIDHSLVDVFRDFALSDGASSSSSSTVGFDTGSRRQEGSKASNVRQKLLEAQQQVFDQMLQKDYPEFVKSDLYFKFLTSHQNSIMESNEESRDQKSSSVQRTSSGTALFSAIGLSSPEKRDSYENPKRASTGSFLDIFGLGRDKDKDKEREQLSHGPMKGTEKTNLGNLRPSFLSTNNSRSKSSSPISTRTIDSGDSSSQSSQQQLNRHESNPKQSLEVSSSTKFASQPLNRTRSLNSTSNPEIPAGNEVEEKSKSSNRNSSSAAEYARDNSLDLTDTEGAPKSAVDDGGTRLHDSLLMELQGNEEDDEGSMGDSQGGVPIPRMSKNRNGKEYVIDAVEAALSSIMETQDTQQEELSNSGIKEKDADPVSVDPTDPSFSTARDGLAGTNALLEWGKSHKKASKRHFKEKTLGSGKTVRVKSQDPSQTGITPLDSIFENENEKPKTKPTSKSETKRASLHSLGGEGVDNGGDAARQNNDEDQSDYSDDDLDSNNKGRGPNPSSLYASESVNDAAQDNVLLAAPGDLLLSTRIKRLEQDIETVLKQQAIVETLIQKAERQGRQNELRILQKSKSALRREILSMEYQKTQYENQEKENMIMPGRSTINITSSTVGHEGSKEFALYVIEVHQLAQDGSFASGWVIARRYSEFFALNQQLKEKFPSIIRQYELPGKRGFLKLQKSFVEGRRIGLERYLQSLVQHMEICQSQELRAFLSQENIALPQFSSASSFTSLPYSLFDNDSQNKDTASSSPSSNQHFFEQLFNSATSPLQSPASSRPLSLTASGTSILDITGRNSMDSISGVDQSDGFMKHIYQTVSEGLDDMFGGPPTVLGNITKQLGNQMMQFTMELDDDDMPSPQSSLSEARRRHGSHGESGNVRLIDSDFTDGTPTSLSSFDLLTASQNSDSTPPLQRPTLQRIQSSRSRRLSSPDPHTQHQRLQLQQQEQKQVTQRQQQIIQQQHKQNTLQQPPPQQQQIRQGVAELEGVTTFTEPLCDLFIELFELKDKNNWLRRQAVVIILQQVMGGTIERKLRDTIKAYIEENMLTFYVLKLRDALWPPVPMASDLEVIGGYEIVGEDPRLSPTLPKSSLGKDNTEAAKKAVRTSDQKATTKDQANRKLSAFLPELLGNVVGHQNARRGARRVFAAFQNRRLNQQLVYTTLDEVIEAMWPELALPSSTHSPVTTSFGMQHGASAAATAGLSSSSATLPPNAARDKSSSAEATAAFPMSSSVTEVSDSGEPSGVLPNEYTIIACNDAALSPTGELPMLHDGKNWIAGTNRIISYLSKTGHNADENLSRESKAKSFSYQALVDVTLTDALLFSWFADSENFVEVIRKAYSDLLSFPGRYYVPIEMKKKAVRRVQKYGGAVESGGSTLAHTEHTKIYDAVRSCYGVLNRQLGKKDYFFGDGDQPTTLDAKVFGYLALQLYPKIPNPRFKIILETQFPQLVAYCDRCRDRFMADVPEALPSTTALQLSSLFLPTFSNPLSWTRGKGSKNNQTSEKDGSGNSGKNKEKPAEQRDFERKRIAAVGLSVLAMIGYVVMNGLISIKLGDDDEEDGAWMEVDDSQEAPFLSEDF
ncbi:Intermediate filament protein [Mortierella sp. AM989]|nr:Intermediate filament protein [Mortierella sp. AM989]